MSRKTVEVGQVVQPGQPLLALVPLDDVWVTANFKESQLKRIRPGQPVEVAVDAYGGRTFRGRVDSIAAATGSRFSLLPPENATGNYVKVVQRIPVKIVGGGSMHYCGPTRPWAHGAIDAPHLRGVNYGNPEMQDLAAEYAYWSRRKVPILLWGDALCLEPRDRDFLGDIRSLGIRTGMTLAIRVKNREEARRMLERHRCDGGAGGP